MRIVTGGRMRVFTGWGVSYRVRNKAWQSPKYRPISCRSSGLVDFNYRQVRRVLREAGCGS